MSDEDLRQVLNGELAGFYGRLVSHVDSRISDLQTHVDRRLDQVQNALAGELKQVETHDQEQAALGSQVDRHQAWIKQLADGTGTRLVPEP